MKPTILRITFLLLFALLKGLPTEAYQQFHCAGALIRMVDSSEAAYLNRQSDAYTRVLTNFDLSARLNQASGLSEQDYLKKSAQSVRSWSPKQEAQLKTSFGQIDSAAKALGISLHLPDTVIVICTNAGEEFSADGYTRNNRIMLNPGVAPISTAIVAHELWHVISRHNQDLRNRAYAVFHFRPCNPVDYKTPFNNLVITNPDCPEIRNYIQIQLEGEETKMDMALMIRAASDFHPGYSLGKYVDPVLVVLTGDDENKRVMMKNGKPIYYSPTQVPDFFGKVGINTPYILHVEEITAENFVALITNRKVQERKYVDSLHTVLKN